MLYNTEGTGRRLEDWREGLARFDLPDWEALPQLDLYMDQVLLLLGRYLGPVNAERDERFITASIINNYVRMKIMPPPVKKKYSRVHIAYLVIICSLKQSLSISSIQRLLPEDWSEETAREAYAQFVGRYRAAAAFIQQMSTGEWKLLPEEEGDFAMTAAILSALSKALTEFLLREEDGEDDYDE